MTALTPTQREELFRYADNQSHNFGARPNKNLIRRNLLSLDPHSGHGFYRLTEFGRAVIAQEFQVISPLMIDELVQNILHHGMGWHESLKKLEELARGNFERLESQKREDKLRAWWPTLTDEQKEQARREFWEQYDEDPEFRQSVNKLLRERPDA